MARPHPRIVRRTREREAAARALRGNDEASLVQLGKELGDVLHRHALQICQIPHARLAHALMALRQIQHAMQRILDARADMRHVHSDSFNRSLAQGPGVCNAG